MTSEQSSLEIWETSCGGDAAKDARTSDKPALEERFDRPPQMSAE